MQANSLELIESIIRTGMQYQGTPYRYRGSRSTTDSFDCSGFIRHIFEEGAGIQLPASSADQALYVMERSKTTSSFYRLARGDLAFFMSYRGYRESDYWDIQKHEQRVTHVAMCLGDDALLHTFGKPGVAITNFWGSHWEYRFLFGGPVL